ncbi:MAG: lysylphosphatidylglycerol synthase domain-containing protein [Ornithinimicrobium sp.]|uniref:lysylphosphatidylglycerol synthase domain-containing protein n=1 Tax=Ornithinimicrobium sp. TaxID=1977084 RepID=UPI0026DF087B|nr:lysylphosphatidylglycerol synthase domain-containing protein [Ornithinimicrobium sp.]MDO5741187.1 lysylphosphatidylglycerol synthase domain-containing protein [Ornithinimicrobium sp.]
MTWRAGSVLRSPWLRRGFLLLAVAAAVIAVVLERDAVGQALAATSWGWVALALVLSLGATGFATMSWRDISAGLGAPLGIRAAGVIYLVGQVGKYLPGGVWNLVASAELGRDHGIARRRTVGTLLVAVLVSAAMAGLLALVLLPGSLGTVLEPYGWLVVLAPLAVVAVVPAVLNYALTMLLRVTRREPLPERIGLAPVVSASVWSLLSWAAVGLQVYVLALAVGADAGMSLLRLSVGGYALAWIVGFVLVFLPAGVGAREAMLALALTPVLGTGGMLVVVVLSRLLVTVADLVAAGLALLVNRAARPG